MNKSNSGFFALLLAAFIYATFGIYIRVLNQDLSVYQQIFLRGLVGFVIASGMIFLFKKRINFSAVSKKILFGYAVLLPLTVILFTLAVLTTKLATVLFGFYVGMLISSLAFGVWFFKEKVDLSKKIAFGLAVIGLVIYTYPLNMSSFNLGLGLSLIAGVMDTVSNSLRKQLSNKVDRFGLVSLQLLGMAIVSLPFVIFTLNGAMPSISPVSWLVAIWFGLMLMVVNYLLLYGFAKFDLNLGTIVLSSELFFVAIIGILIYNETVTITEWVGVGLIILAMVTTSVDVNKFVKKLKFSLN
ncbi:MAG TPA: DMT family transporter [Candidatus Woesebacteria bacterium]|nr:DMT family transporter [Candidatus Woesebacteria bacterium]